MSVQGKLSRLLKRIRFAPIADDRRAEMAATADIKKYAYGAELCLPTKAARDKANEALMAALWRPSIGGNDTSFGQLCTKGIYLKLIWLPLFKLWSMLDINFDSTPPCNRCSRKAGECEFKVTNITTLDYLVWWEDLSKLGYF